MKHLNIQNPLLTFFAVMLLACTSEAMAANCTFEGSPTTQTLNFGVNLANNGLSIPADTPDGTVVYQDTVQQSNRHSWSCSASSLYGVKVNPTLGPQPNGGHTFPLGKTGLSFRIWMGMLDRYEPSLFSTRPVGYAVASGSIRLEIIKSGTLTSNVTVQAGNLGNLQAGELILNRFNLASPLVLNTASCQTPAVSVQMGDDYRLDEFNKTGDTPRLIKFNIGLNQCQNGIKKVTYSLKANTGSQAVDPQKGIVALNNGPKAAKGIGLQLMNDVGHPIALDTTYPFSGFDTAGTSFNIPLTAAYYRLADGKLEAGIANASVTFIVNYL